SMAAPNWGAVYLSMAAPNWGAVYLPRIGHEVVTFLEGDPDRPLITGAVYNGLHKPPYELPEHKTRTVFRTQSHKADGYNEMYFEDENDQEMVHFRAQKDMKTKVLNNRYRDIGNDEELEVGRNQENNVLADRKETIHGHKTSETKQTFKEQVDQDVAVTYNANEHKQVAKDQHLSIDENRQTKIGKDMSLQIGGKAALAVLEGLSANIGVDDSLQVNRQTDQHLSIDENRQTKIGKDMSLQIGGKAALAVLEGLSANIGVDDSLQVGGNLNVDVQGNTSFRADGGTTIISGDEIKVQVGYAGLILKSNGNIKLYGSSITIDGAAQTTINGGKVAINPDKGNARLNVRAAL
ncbi:type VI secretion system Vgr family protein, partial [Vibrio pectenicida]|uniref:type VI secretion system Vgr family protein n=1 Tax=Vibrio pectenicida TaxID=62763 RepID=UPI001C8CBFE9